MSIKFITNIIRLIAKDIWEKSPSGIETAKVTIDPLKKVKMTPQELEDHMKANRGTGYHKNPAEKRQNNPKKQINEHD